MGHLELQSGRPSAQWAREGSDEGGGGDSGPLIRPAARQKTTETTHRTPVFSMRHSPGGYYVYHDGVLVHCPASLERSRSALDRLRKKARQKVRKCLTCRERFHSDGPHHRMCDACRRLNVHDGYV